MKKMFIVSAIMLFAVGAMTSCKDSVDNGCHCTATYQGETREGDVPAEKLKELGYTSCKAYAADMEKAAKLAGEEMSVSCKGK